VKALGASSGGATPPAVSGYVEPSLAEITSLIGEAGLRLDDQTIRRYHLSLKTRGFVVLSGLSGSGKTWLAQLYAEAVGARCLPVPVAPNWTSNEDLLGYYDPLAKVYRHTPFSRFLEHAAAAWEEARAAGVDAQPFHLLLDEMNLARVEYYFAKFLSAMELRARAPDRTVSLELDAETVTELTPNLRFVGTVNIDETTHGFADKIYDRAQLIEIPVGQAGIEAHLAGRSYAARLLEVWLVMRPVAPFAYRVLDEIDGYVTAATAISVATHEALDEQLLQKVLPKIRGTDSRIGPALTRFVEIAADDWPLSRGKAEAMLVAFEKHGFTTYFEA
jgi:AAA domain (dynein-related subfamily)